MSAVAPGMAAQSASSSDRNMRAADSDADIIACAAEWHAHLHSGVAVNADYTSFECWRAQDSRHAEIYARMEKLWSRFDGMDAKPATMALNKALKSGAAKRKKVAVQALALCLAVFGTWTISQTKPAKYMLADYRTGVGEQRVIELDDHSRITLNTHSAIDVDYSGKQRRITLQQGEILVEVAKDSTRPFIVETEHGTARALGTQYLVKREVEGTRVTVIESTVEACAAKVPACVTLAPGEQTVVTPDAVQAPSMVNAEASASWSKHTLVVDNQPLAQVLQELARYRYGRIFFNADEIADLRVSGVYSLDDTDRTLSVLVATTPIRVKQYTHLFVTVSPLK